MTVCLTGDVHHMSLETRDQEYIDRTEVEVAIEYAEIAAEYDVPVTLFITGKAAAEEPKRVERLAAMDNVEIGGHNYWAFDTPIHSGWRALQKLTRGKIGSWNGPRPFQRYEIYRTIEALSECGVDVTSWRDHAYRHDRHTLALLADAGITHFSDAVGPEEHVRQDEGISIVPVTRHRITNTSTMRFEPPGQRLSKTLWGHSAASRCLWKSGSNGCLTELGLSSVRGE